MQTKIKLELDNKEKLVKKKREQTKSNVSNKVNDKRKITRLIQKQWRNVR